MAATVRELESMVPGPLGSRLNEMWVLSHRLIRWVDFLSLAKLFLKKCRVIFICLHSSNTSLRYTYIFYPPLKVGENGRAYNYKKRKEETKERKKIMIIRKLPSLVISA